MLWRDKNRILSAEHLETERGISVQSICSMRTRDEQNNAAIQFAGTYAYANKKQSIVYVAAKRTLLTSDHVCDTISFVSCSSL